MLDDGELVEESGGGSSRAELSGPGGFGSWTGEDQEGEADVRASLGTSGVAAQSHRGDRFQ